MARLLLVLSLLLPVAICDLPTDFDVQYYDLALNVSSNFNNPVEGRVNITLYVVKNTSTIVMHWGTSLLPSTPSSSNFAMNYTDPTGTVTTVTSFDTSVNAANQLTIATTPPATGGVTFGSGGTVTMVVKFQAIINVDIKGLFYRQYLIENNKNNAIILTNLRPTFARDLFPCLDEPVYFANSQLTLTYPSSWAGAASGIVLSSTTDKRAGTTTSIFSGSNQSPNTLAFFLAENMTQRTYSVARSKTKLSFWGRKGLSSSTFYTNVQFLSEFYYIIEDLLNLASPSELLNVVMVPGLEEPFSGYGVVFIREDNYAQDYISPQLEGFFKNNVAPVFYQFLRQFTEFYSHPRSWTDYWVSQAISKYLQYLILNTVVPIFDFKTDLEVVARQTALYLDSLPNAKPLQDMSVTTDSTASVQASINDPLKGFKGAAILNMLDQSFPAGTVFEAIKNFLSTTKGSETSTDIFLRVMKSIPSSAPVSRDAQLALDITLTYWINTTRYPLEAVKAFSSGSPGTINFTTTGYCSVMDPSCSTTLPGSYYVSATVGSKSDNRYYRPRQDFWVTNEDAYRTIDINFKDTDWIVANMKSAGYYRSNYDVDNWGRIIDALSSADQKLVGRTQLLDDAFALALSSADPLDYNVTFRLALANLGNTLYRDWVPVQRGLQGIRDNLLGLNQYIYYKNFAAGYFLNLNEFLQNRSSDAYEMARIQALFMDDMCEYDIPGYRASALTNLSDILQGTLPKTVPSSAYDVLACCGARYNSTLKAQVLWNTLADSTLNYYSRRFAAIALGCLSNYTDVAQLFNTMTMVNVQLKPYIQMALENVAEKNPVNFLANFTALADKFQSQLGGASVASLIVRAGRKINNNTQAAVLDAINNNANVDPVVKIAAKSTRDAIGYKVTWLSKNNASLVVALQTHTLPSGTSGASIPTVISLLVFLPSLLHMLSAITV